MKKHFTNLFLGLGVCGITTAQTIVTGPSSSQPSYLQPLVPGSTVTSIITATNVVGNYTMAGLPDGLGAFDSGNGQFTVIMNHEMANNAGAVHAHGQTGAFLSKWVINKSNLAVVSGTDVIQTVNLWTGTTYTAYSATNPSTLAAFTRFCSGDLPPVSAYYNSATGKGTQERIFMNGEEAGNEGRAFAHIITGPAAGNTYELPYLGKASWENYVACPFQSDKTIVVGMDDTTPGQVYVYVGTKKTSGLDIDKAGLTGGKLYGVAVLGLLNEVSSGVPSAGTAFNLLDLGSIQNSTGATINTNSNNMGVTNFLRPEDGAWDPSNPRDFYFVTTNSFTSPSRMWRLRFNDITNPELGGTIEAVLNGTEGQKMMDNIGIDHFGNIMIVEDVGGNIHNGKVWQYKIASDALSLFAQHDTTRFITGGANFLTIDEEASGIIDVQEILGPGMFLTVDQAHYAIPGSAVEGGQLLALYNPAGALSNPEIAVSGNNTVIAPGSTITSSGNNTNFGASNVNTGIIKNFIVTNTGTGMLSVTGVSIGGINAGDFGLVSPPPFPANIAPNGTLVIPVQFNPALTGTRLGNINIMNNDFDESAYTFNLEGMGVVPEINIQGNSVSIPAGNLGINTTNNTDFGNIYLGYSQTNNFSIQNTGAGTLTIYGLTIAGLNSNEFTLVNPPAFPLVLAGNGSQSFSIKFLPLALGTRSAKVVVSSNDSDESSYDYMIEGKGVTDVGLTETRKSETQVMIYPNPTKDEATLKFQLEDNTPVTISVFDIQGKLAMSPWVKDLVKGEQQLTLNTASLANGKYFVKINTGNKTSTAKMIVVH